MNGYFRYTFGRHIVRIAVDKQKTYNYLFSAWGSSLGPDFYRWLLTSKTGDSFLLIKGVTNPEYWIMADSK